MLRTVRAAAACWLTEEDTVPLQQQEWATRITAHLAELVMSVTIAEGASLIRKPLRFGQDTAQKHAATQVPVVQAVEAVVSWLDSRTTLVADTQSAEVVVVAAAVANYSAATVAVFFAVCSANLVAVVSAVVLVAADAAHKAALVTQPADAVVAAVDTVERSVAVCSAVDYSARETAPAVVAAVANYSAVVAVMAYFVGYWADASCSVAAVVTVVARCPVTQPPTSAQPLST